MSVHLPGGLVLRTATVDDLPATMHLLAERGEPADARDLALVVESDGFAGTAVVVDGDRVVSTATLLDEVVHVDGIGVPAGQVELVATAHDFEGRGLVRTLMGWAHERSQQRGHLLQVMVGIPFFYRQFGYAYAMPMAPWRPLVDAPPPVDGVLVRPASPADIRAMAALHEAAQQGVDVRMSHSPSAWRWLIEGEATEQWVAERDGELVGVARWAPDEDESALAELAAADDGAALALVAHAAAAAEGDVVVQDGAGVEEAVAGHLGDAADKPDWFYARIARLGPLLTHLAPVLQARSAAAGFGDEEHEVLLSSWRSHLRFAVGPSGIRLLAEGGPEQAPLSKGGSGVPPDALAPLLLGPHGALGLEQRLPDCYLGYQRDLLAALFPPRTCDLATFYLPR